MDSIGIHERREKTFFDGWNTKNKSIEVGTSSVLLGEWRVQLFGAKSLNYALRKRIEAVLGKWYHSFQIWEKMGTMPYLFIMQLGETIDVSQCIRLVFMCSLMSSMKNFILGLFGNWKGCQHLQSNTSPSVSNNYSDGREK